MSRSLFRQALGRALPVGVALGLAAPAMASAADAPLRPIAFDATGAPVSGIGVYGINPAGTEILQQLGVDSSPLIRNVAAGATTVISAVKNASVVNASTDLRRFLFETTDALSPADTNVTRDYYVFDRTSGTTTLVSRSSTGGPALGSPYSEQLTGGVLSGDGTAVLYSQYKPEAPAPLDGKQDTDRRYSMATGAVTLIANGLASYRRPTDAAGTVAINDKGVFVGSKRFDLPTPNTYFTLEPQVSPDGGTVAFLEDSYQKTGRLALLNTGTGVLRLLTVPSWLTQQRYDLMGVANGGGSVLVGTRFTRTAGERYVIGRLDANSGAVTQLGGDIPITTSSREPSAFTPDYGFAVNGAFMIQLGSAAIPGTPIAPVPVKATAYTHVIDSQCVNTGIFTRAYSRPSITLLGAQDGDPHQPLKADIIVRNTATGAIANQFSLELGKYRELTVGKNGGWNFTAKITFTDGTSVTGTKDVPKHNNPPCEPYWF